MWQGFLVSIVTVFARVLRLGEEMRAALVWTTEFYGAVPRIIAVVGQRKEAA